MAITTRGPGRRPAPAVLRGDRVYLAGELAEKTVGGSVAAQTREILARIERRLIEAGTDKSRLIAASIRLTDMAAFAEMDAVWDAWTADGRTPGRATVEARLPGPGQAVEIAVVAAR